MIGGLGISCHCSFLKIKIQENIPVIQPHSIVQLECQNAYHHCGYVMENLNAQMAVMRDKKCVVSCIKPISCDLS